MISIYYLANAFALLIYLLYWGAGFITFYHLTRFGVGIQPKRLAAVFFIGSITLFLISIMVFARTDLESLITLLK